MTHRPRRFVLIPLLVLLCCGVPATGNSQTQLALIWCVVSKSDTARSCFGSQALITWSPNPPAKLAFPSKRLTRSALDP